MKMSGSIRRTERKTSPSVASRKAPPLSAFQDGTARPGPDVHLSGPGYFFPAGPSAVVSTVPKSVAPQLRATSYFIPLERKSRWRSQGGNFHE
jgi:hypothetical protein